MDTTGDLIVAKEDDAWKAIPPLPRTRQQIDGR